MKCGQSSCGRQLEKCSCSHGCSRCQSGYRCPRHGKDWAYKTNGGFFSSGSSGSGKKCRKCGCAVVNCRPCRGIAGKTCRECGGTGQTCPTHGQHWR